ncbi:hypothetical protein DP939_02180 [Spongiactinospora rosea]|uniref:Uncharacterized protein n=1 Tax=Spongiactinospora rosea TaxID=2248750 RepID=A0A366M5K0_9ACTN|nr:hypothetical protein [Spongiactinospora rosea]RBQ21538.1 hypothetical protein DP939_02180 [Spongiactinospora rosea]
MKLRTQDEIAVRIRAVADADIFGFRSEVLLGALDLEHVRRFNPEITAADWRDAPDAAGLLAEAESYHTFAIGKIRDHRGISALRSVAKLGEYAWLLCRDDVVVAMDAAPYEQYGAPKVKSFGVGFDLGWPDEPELNRMAAGDGCCPDCEEGCGR